MAKADVPLSEGGRMMVPEVMRRPKPSWWAKAYPERMLRLRKRERAMQLLLEQIELVS